MWPYLVCFILSSLFLYLSEKAKYSIGKRILVFLALVIPCVLAGLRDLTIGTDVLVYLDSMYLQAQISESFDHYLNLKISGNRFVYKYEIGFTIVVYIISNIFKSINVLMFVVEALIIVPIYFGCKKIPILKGKLWLCMFVYYCLFFNYGLNAMREFIGLSISFYGICSYLYCERNGFKKYVLFSIIAFLFHKSSILSIITIIVHKILSNNSSKQKYILYNNKKISINKLSSIVVIAVSTYILFNLEIFNSLLYSIEGFSRYVSYYSGNIFFSVNNLMKVLPIIIIMIFLLKKFVSKYDNSMFYTTIFCFGWLIFSNISTASTYGDRVSNMFKLISIIIYPLLTLSPNTKKGRNISTILIIAYSLFYFWYIYAYKGYHHTIPYIFG